MAENFWRKLVETSLQTDEEEMSCLECMEILDQYVDLLDAGQDPSTILPQLEHHLCVCHCCHSEFEGILTALKAAVEDTPDNDETGLIDRPG
jgi:hypothetical protein